MVLTGVKDDIPYTFNVINSRTNEKFELLVLIPGRSPLCFKCKQTRHYRSDCFTPQCRACGVFGHTYESCAVANSYSNALRGSAKPQSGSTPTHRLTTTNSKHIQRQREMAAAADDGTEWAIIRRRSVIVSGKKGVSLLLERISPILWCQF